MKGRTAEERLRAAIGLGYSELLRGEPQAALDALPDSVPAGVSDEALGALHNLEGGAQTRLGLVEAARGSFQRARDLGLASVDVGLSSRAALNLAFLDRRAGRLQEAAGHLEGALDELEGTDLLIQRALVANNLGTVARDRGDFALARVALQRARRLRARAADAFGEASSAGSLALLDLECGRLLDARVCLEESAAFFGENGHPTECVLVTAHPRARRSVGGKGGSESRAAGPSAGVRELAPLCDRPRRAGARP